MVGAKNPGNMATDGLGEPAPAFMNHNSDSGMSDELVSSVSLYRRRSRFLHGTVLPFAGLLYPAWLYVWIGVYGPTEYPEAGLLGLAAIGIAHVLTVLSGYWSVHAHCWLTCSKVMRCVALCVCVFVRVVITHKDDVCVCTLSFPTCLLLFS